MKRYGVAGTSVALIERGEIVWVCALGLADVTGGYPLTGDAVFRVESISKPVTAWGVMTLVERGLIDLDEPLVHYLSDWRFPPSAVPTDRITVRQLLTHTAGLPLGDFTARFPLASSPPSLREYLSRHASPLTAAPAPFAYSNVGFDLLELLIEEVSGERFADYLQREVLDPLGMMPATFDWNPSIAERVPTAYALDGEPIAPYVYPGRGSGGLLASVEAIARFAIAGMDTRWRPAHEVLGTSAIETLQTPFTSTRGVIRLAADAYAAGHFVETLPDGRRSLWHGGQGYGWMSHVQWVPETGDGIVVLSNSQRAWPLFAAILSDWARWRALPPPGMTRIRGVIVAAWFTVGAGTLLAVWFGVQTVRGLRSRARAFAPGARTVRGRRLLMLLSAVAIGSGLAWAGAQDYLFLTSVAPHVVRPLAIVLLAVVAALTLSALCPPRSSENAPGTHSGA